MSNPFDELQAQLNRIEGLMHQILHQQTSNTSLAEDRPMTIKDAAAFLNTTTDAIYQNPAIPRHKKRNKLVFFQSELMAYLKSPAQPDLSTLLKRRGAKKSVG